ncbi:MAG: sulfatase-like hydrolase/transferase [Planctomycetaceae bacterium]|nr:sulfatase-like hydrolase/transferase [Planctomycetaceae bacterium]MCB9952458.1 sulfatase-like hydrolase/transferase [Planctomycetaceae bacterium]
MLRSKRTTRGQSLTALLAISLSLMCLRFASAESQPNVVIMLADDLGWGAVSYHNDWAETPNIDRFTREGIELDRFYVAPMCSPTRAGLMTGRYPIRFGLARAVIPPYRDFGLPVEEQTIAEALAKAGYKHRGIFGKWHLGHHRQKWHPISRGFTQFEGHYNGAIDYFSLDREGERDWHVGMTPAPDEGYSTDLITEAASDFIAKAAAEEAPYFCYVPFNAPHSPFQAQPEDIRRYVKGKRKPSNEELLKAMIWRMDQSVGQILEAIEATGEAENTQVWFLSDNGGVGQFKQNNVPLHGAKLTAFEGGVRVVASVCWPAKWKGGRKLEQTMGYIDVLPTVLESAGVDPAEAHDSSRPLDGTSLCGFLSGETTEFPERDWYSYHGQSGPDKETIAVKTADWKLIVMGPDIRKSPLGNEHEVHLYKMPEDLLEQINLAEQHPDVVAELYAKLQAHRSLQPENGNPPYGEGSQGFVPWKDWDIRTRE